MERNLRSSTGLHLRSRVRCQESGSFEFIGAMFDEALNDYVEFGTNLNYICERIRALSGLKYKGIEKDVELYDMREKFNLFLTAQEFLCDRLELTNEEMSKTGGMRIKIHCIDRAINKRLDGRRIEDGNGGFLGSFGQRVENFTQYLSPKERRLRQDYRRVCELQQGVPDDICSYQDSFSSNAWDQTCQAVGAC